MDKLIISNTQKKEIYEKSISGVSLRKLVDEYGYSFTVIQKLVNSYNYDQKISINYPQKDGYYMVAICNKTKKEYDDYTNKSGILTNIVFEQYPDESKNSKYVRKSKEYSTGKFWYDEYFTFEYRKNKEIKKCHYCEWTTEDINNLSGAYEKHLKNNHNITIKEHLNTFVGDTKYFKLSIPIKDGLSCKICGKKLRIINDKHLKKHNITVNDYRLKYGDLMVSSSTHEKLKKSVTRTNMLTKKSKTSKAENEIKDFIVDNGVLVKQSVRKILNGNEIDLYLPDYNVGIEYNGNLYHTEKYGKKDFNYHLNKTKLASEKNIDLYQIFEDEWDLKGELVKSKILHIINKNNSIVLHARKCKIIETPINTSNKFLNENHIQGKINGGIVLGAYYNNDLIAVMSFNNKRNMNKEKRHNNTIFELTRFCVKNNVIISGIGNRLLKHFINRHNPTSIISFADRRWTPNPNNNLYVKLGFTLIKILPPDYSYYDRKLHRGTREHKFNYGKSSIKRKFPDIYDENKTEWEMMQELGYDRIWDCGKFKYELTIN